MLYNQSCAAFNLLWHIRHSVRHYASHQVRSDTLAQSCQQILQACRSVVLGRRDPVGNPRTWSVPRHLIRQTRLDLAAIIQRNWSATKTLAKSITILSITFVCCPFSCIAMNLPACRWVHVGTGMDFSFFLSRMHVMDHNWSAKKQHIHQQSVARISCHSALLEDSIRQYVTSSGSHCKDTDQCL